MIERISEELNLYYSNNYINTSTFQERSYNSFDKLKNTDFQFFNKAIVVGGHNVNSSSLKSPICLSYDGFFLKPLLKKKEGDFYLKGEEEASKNDEYFKKLTHFIPKCLSVIEFDNVEYLVLENLYKSFKKPCILDLKMGIQTYEDDAPEHKKEYELQKFPLQSQLGFRITGFKKIVSKSHLESDFELNSLEKSYQDGYIQYEATPKMLRKNFTTIEEVKSLLQYFFACENCDIWPIFESKVYEILEIMRKQHSFKFIASSLLFIFEGDINEPINGRIGIIDFAHATKSSLIDEGYVFGLEKILSMMKDR